MEQSDITTKQEEQNDKELESDTSKDTEDESPGDEE